jgi:peptidyl-prolyl cis-trans isomerase C
MTAVQSLKPGDFTHTPVKSRYGWHVIEVREVRAVAPADFNSVEAQLAANITAERYQKYLAAALRETKVEQP